MFGPVPSDNIYLLPSSLVFRQLLVVCLLMQATTTPVKYNLCKQNNVVKNSNHSACRSDQSRFQPENHREGTVVVTVLGYHPPLQRLISEEAKISSASATNYV